MSCTSFHSHVVVVGDVLSLGVSLVILLQLYGTAVDGCAFACLVISTIVRPLECNVVLHGFGHFGWERVKSLRRIDDSVNLSEEVDTL